MSDVQSTVTYRDIPGHPGYRVGNDGSVWSCWRLQTTWPEKRGWVLILSDVWKLMKPKPGKKGHIRVRLRGRGRLLVHRLVLEAFVGPCPAGMECCHGDGNPRNNKLDNLRWDTKIANAADRKAHGRDAQGVKHYLSKLTEQDVRDIRVAYAAGNTTQAKLGLLYGVDHTNIHCIVNRLSWKHVE